MEQLRNSLGIYGGKQESFKSMINQAVPPNPPELKGNKKKEKKPEVTDSNGLPIDKKNLQKVSRDRNMLEGRKK